MNALVNLRAVCLFARSIKKFSWLYSHFKEQVSGDAFSTPILKQPLLVPLFGDNSGLNLLVVLLLVGQLYSESSNLKWREKKTVTLILFSISYHLVVQKLWYELRWKITTNGMHNYSIFTFLYSCLIIRKYFSFLFDNYILIVLFPTMRKICMWNKLF